MRKNKIVAVLISCFVTMSLWSQTNQSVLPEEDNTTISVIHKRTSIRQFTDQKLTKEQLETLVRAGMAAPSSVNAQPWHFIIVDDPELLQLIGGSVNTSKSVSEAPAAILVCGDMHKAKEGWLQQYWIQDCSAASQNILLAATSMGLGAVWTSIYPAEDRIKKVAEILSLPNYIIPLNVIPVGYPKTPKQPMDKWKPTNVSWNIWK
ncbi:nitroreductase family protein [Dysgonomonas macrotermitis]|uniref:Nitroreductase n=1 Tax=Dysgonomonas macrotermitis TaxID=1346286 RepID=A0A1M5BS23_9BACT|nr:nitroreductase family protein [Dysgonomonas macrotermitis]SHF45161.1 Nitroreductase [Dysgonomonas macrotermitis]